MLTILGAIALSATAYYLSIGLGPFWPAVWIAPIPVLVVAARRRARTAALIAFAASFAGSLNLLTFLARVMPLPIVIVMLALTSLVCVTAVLSARLAMQALPGGIAAFAFPATWTAGEFVLRLRARPRGTGRIADAERRLRPDRRGDVERTTPGCAARRRSRPRSGRDALHAVGRLVRVAGARRRGRAADVGRRRGVSPAARG